MDHLMIPNAKKIPNIFDGTFKEREFAASKTNSLFEEQNRQYDTSLYFLPL